MQNAKDALNNLSYGVYVVSSFRGDEYGAGDEDDLEINAMTVRMVSQVCTRPPMLSLSVRKNSLTHEYICESGVFALHVLAQGQELLAGHFGLRSGRQTPKFAALDYQRGETGAPIFDQCRGWMECRLRASHDMGTFVLIIGEIVNVGCGVFNDKPTLVYRKSDYYG